MIKSFYVDNFKPHFDLYSQAGQDLFVIALTGEKKQGTFLEIGAGHPHDGSNTYLLEKDFNWAGLSIDNNRDWNENLEDLWKEIRPNTTFLNQDANQVDNLSLMLYYDYLQIDIDPPMANLSILEKLLKKCSFGCITFEHDFFRGTSETEYVRQKSRELLKEHGYDLAVSDVSIPKTQWTPQPVTSFEDWYVNLQYIDKKIYDYYSWTDDNVQYKFWQDIFHIGKNNATR